MVKDTNEVPTDPVAVAPPNGVSIRAAKKVPVGFIGLGRMGAAMAANLAAAGYQVISYVRRTDQMDKLAALGLKPTTEIADVFDCEVVISMLPDDTAVRDVVFGRKDLGIEGLASGLKPGAIHLSMSTISTASRVSSRQASMRVTGKATSQRRSSEIRMLRRRASSSLSPPGCHADVERCQPLIRQSRTTNICDRHRPCDTQT